MDGKYIFLFFGIMVLVIASMQVYNTYSFESSFGTYEDYAITWQNTPEELRESNPYSSYRAIWTEHANVNPVFPALFLVSFFGWIGYMYYKDWEIGRMKNVRNYLGVRTNGL
jgi:hypothetical protein